MNIKELLAHIDTFAPFSLAEEWDNPGLMVGSLNAEVKKVAIALDATSDAVVAAEEQGCDVLVCHHPLIFRPVKHVWTDEETTGRTIAEAIRRNIAIIAAHTNWDKADGGVNDTLAALLGLKDTEPLTEDFGVRGIHDGLTPEHIKSSWQLSHLDVYAGHMPERISRVALCGGSGGEFWRAARQWGADMYITADMKYHELIDATRSGLAVAVADHGEMERASLPELGRKISLCGIETVLLDIKALADPLRL